MLAANCISSRVLAKQVPLVGGALLRQAIIGVFVECAHARDCIGNCFLSPIFIAGSNCASAVRARRRY